MHSFLGCRVLCVEVRGLSVVFFPNFSQRFGARGVEAGRPSSICRAGCVEAGRLSAIFRVFDLVFFTFSGRAQSFTFRVFFPAILGVAGSIEPSTPRKLQPWSVGKSIGKSIGTSIGLSVELSV